MVTKEKDETEASSDVDSGSTIPIDFCARKWTKKLRFLIFSSVAEGNIEVASAYWIKCTDILSLGGCWILPERGEFRKPL